MGGVAPEGQSNTKMSVITEFSVKLDAIPVGKVVNKEPEAYLEFKSTVPAESFVFPFLWVWGRSPVSVEPSLREVPEVESVTCLDIDDEGGLFQVEWSERTKERLSTLVGESDVAVLNASTDGDYWRMKVLANRYEKLKSFQRRCDDRGIEPEPLRVYEPTEGERETEYHLTPEQREALTVALDDGYFDQPRRTTLEELSSQLGISRQALSGRLRRGHRNLIRSTLRSP